MVKYIDDDEVKMNEYYNYYLKAKFAIEKMGLDAVIHENHDAKVIIVDKFRILLVENVVLIFANGKRVFYFDPDEWEIESIDGGWMRLIDIIYNTAIDVEEEQKAKINKPIK